MREVDGCFVFETRQEAQDYHEWLNLLDEQAQIQADLWEDHEGSWDDFDEEETGTDIAF